MTTQPQQLPLWSASDAPPRDCPRCGRSLICVGFRDYGVFREYRYIGCACYATQTIVVNRALKGKRP
jgi:hypothetical protein